MVRLNRIPIILAIASLLIASCASAFQASTIATSHLINPEDLVKNPPVA